MTRRQRELDEAARLKRVAARARFKAASDELARVFREYEPTHECYEQYTQARREHVDATVELWEGNPPRESKLMERLFALWDRRIEHDALSTLED
jgi:hypothetical protein